MSRKYQIHLKSQSGPIHVLLVNKDTCADSPVVTPVPPPAIETNGNSLQIKQDAMETDVSNSSDCNAGAGTSNNVKTEIMESSQGMLLQNNCTVNAILGVKDGSDLLNIVPLILYFIILLKCL